MSLALAGGFFTTTPPGTPLKLPNNPAIPQLGIYPEKTITQKDTCTPMFIAALFTTARTWKQPRCPLTGEWIKKRGAYIQWNISHKKGCI